MPNNDMVKLIIFQVGLCALEEQFNMASRMWNKWSETLDFL